MPGMGIVPFRREVDRLRPRTPIVVYSAFDCIGDDIEALGFKFMRKPFDETTLKQFVPV